MPIRSDEGRAHRGARYRRPARRAARNRAGTDSLPGGGYSGAVAVLARNSKCQSDRMKDVLTEALDIDGLRDVLRGIEQGRIRCLAVDTPVPSQFSHEILNANQIG